MSGYNDMIDELIRVLKNERGGTSRIPEVIAQLERMRPDSDKVMVRSIFGHQTQKPYVEIHVVGERIVQWSPEEARGHAVYVFEAAEAAEQDAFFIAFLTQRVGGTEDAAIGVLQEYRAFRAAQREKGQ